MPSTISFVFNSNVNVKESDLWGLIGRDELYIEKAPGLNRSNGMLVVQTNKQSFPVLFTSYRALMFGFHDSGYREV